MTELKDAAGYMITKGWAATLDSWGRGSINARRVYVVGTKGTTLITYLANLEAIEHYRNTGSLEDLPVNYKKHTRIIMCNVND